MSKILIGYARDSTAAQDLTAQRDALANLGVEFERIWVDHGFTSTNKNRARLREALATCRAGIIFVVAKLDRLARSVLDAHELADDLIRMRTREGTKGAKAKGRFRGKHPQAFSQVGKTPSRTTCSRRTYQSRAI
ncbi:recombinase family protein [Arthrobacter sp. 35W]|uniref:recombinase family protein n=1 Tax=Arthrobacter sp. 35W TaxID=1132441 RepID=UPI003FA4C750